jgi:hypothetical protein
LSDLAVALGLVLVIEGLLYAVFPAGMKRAVAQALALPENILRRAGLIAAASGVAIVWVVRG